LRRFYTHTHTHTYQVFPDVAAGVVTSLEEEFAFLLTRKDAASATLEARVRVSGLREALATLEATLKACAGEGSLQVALATLEATLEACAGVGSLRVASATLEATQEATLEARLRVSSLRIK